MSIQSYQHVPGLFLDATFLSPSQCTALVEHSLEMHRRLNAQVEVGDLDCGTLRQTNVSKQHNLPSEESYLRIRLNESSDRKIVCEHFPRYGEDGHALTYFRGSRNLPDFLIDSTLNRITDYVFEHQFGATPNQPLTPDTEIDWRLTANFYCNLDGEIAGFPFHIDIPANGMVTMILNIHREATFQITDEDEDKLEEIELPIGSLLVLSGEARYEWKHRVLPTASANTAGDVERISLVLGYKFRTN